MAIYQQLKIFSGTANPELSEKMAKYIGVPLGQAQIKRFSDGEIFVEVDENVRGMDVYVVQPTCSPVNENLCELLIMIDTLKRASADKINAVIPYYGYARQDRKVQPRTPITSKMVADLLTAAGANRIISMDLHAGQIQGFFNIPFDHLYATPIFLDYATRQWGEKDLVIVSPDAGGTERARAYAKRLNAELAIIDKRRERPNESAVMHLIGDVQGKKAILVDDIVDTAGTLCNAAQSIMDHGAKSVVAICTHPVLSGAAVQKIHESPLQQLVVSDTIPLGDKAKKTNKICVLTVAEILGEAIRRIHTGDSVSSLFI
ncbi:MAG: ribose-phosphate pyrophosphokinase [Deltaproteobacteria bacterium]|nr:ribose-phosphate pyrophosphokinase [Deltaproteobacteria bacterium]MBI4196562.1 ribose-phosphate pyrophosphokinase [Deltaproteobacteria bacterium]